MLFQSMDESSSLKDISIPSVTWSDREKKKALTWIFLDFYLSYDAFTFFFHGTFAFLSVLTLKEVQRNTSVGSC